MNETYVTTPIDMLLRAQFTLRVLKIEPVSGWRADINRHSSYIDITDLLREDQKVIEVKWINKYLTPNSYNVLGFSETDGTAQHVLNFFVPIVKMHYNLGGQMGVYFVNYSKLYFVVEKELYDEIAPLCEAV